MDVYKQIVEKISKYKSGESRKGRNGLREGEIEWMEVKKVMYFDLR